MVLYVLSHRKKLTVNSWQASSHQLDNLKEYFADSYEKLQAYQHNWNWFRNKVGMEGNTLLTHTRNSRPTTRENFVIESGSITNVTGFTKLEMEKFTDQITLSPMCSPVGTYPQSLRNRN